ncbi:hypothetical protein HKX48_005094 [Thoreauomyces humboldtii]|nr:hypothetical protein HKX48_005094 [Thoreauomyces humboldtii]
MSPVPVKSPGPPQQQTNDRARLRDRVGVRCRPCGFLNILDEDFAVTCGVDGTADTFPGLRMAAIQVLLAGFGFVTSKSLEIAELQSRIANHRIGVAGKERNLVETTAKECAAPQGTMVPMPLRLLPAPLLVAPQPIPPPLAPPTDVDAMNISEPVVPEPDGEKPNQPQGPTAKKNRRRNRSAKRPVVIDIPDMSVPVGPAAGVSGLTVPPGPKEKIISTPHPEKALSVKTVAKDGKGNDRAVVVKPTEAVVNKGKAGKQAAAVTAEASKAKSSTNLNPSESKKRTTADPPPAVEPVSKKRKKGKGKVADDMAKEPVVIPPIPKPIAKEISKTAGLSAKPKQPQPASKPASKTKDNVKSQASIGITVPVPSPATESSAIGTAARTRAEKEIRECERVIACFQDRPRLVAAIQNLTADISFTEWDAKVLELTYATNEPVNESVQVTYL